MVKCLSFSPVHRAALASVDALSKITVLEPSALCAVKLQRTRGPRIGFGGVDKLSSHWGPRVSFTTADHEQPFAMRREKLVGIKNEDNQVVPQNEKDGYQSPEKTPSASQSINILDAKRFGQDHRNQDEQGPPPTRSFVPATQSNLGSRRERGARWRCVHFIRVTLDDARPPGGAHDIRENRANDFQGVP